MHFFACKYLFQDFPFWISKFQHLCEIQCCQNVVDLFVTYRLLKVLILDKVSLKSLLQFSYASAGFSRQAARQTRLDWRRQALGDRHARQIKRVQLLGHIKRSGQREGWDSRVKSSWCWVYKEDIWDKLIVCIQTDWWIDKWADKQIDMNLLLIDI